MTKESIPGDNQSEIARLKTEVAQMKAKKAQKEAENIKLTQELAALKQERDIIVAKISELNRQLVSLSEKLK